MELIEVRVGMRLAFASVNFLIVTVVLFGLYVLISQATYEDAIS